MFHTVSFFSYFLTLESCSGFIQNNSNVSSSNLKIKKTTDTCLKYFRLDLLCVLLTKSFPELIVACLHLKLCFSAFCLLS